MAARDLWYPGPVAATVPCFSFECTNKPACETSGAAILLLLFFNEQTNRPPDRNDSAQV
jgi:hypothetical protein